MTREEIIDILTPMARKIFEKEDLVITDDLSAENVDAWTSLSFTQFLTAIEEEFHIKFKIMDILTLQNMGAIIDAIEIKTKS